MELSEKMGIREIEDKLSTITESIMKMGKCDRLFCLLTYYQVKKHLSFGEGPHKYFLDIGCGDGLFLKILSDENHGSRENFTYVGIDISLRKLYSAQSKAIKLKRVETYLVLADAEHLPFKEGLFEIGTAIEVMEHLLDTKVFFSELHRVSMTQGKIVVTTPSAYGTKGTFLTFLKRICFMSTSTANREKFIVVEGKKLPHRDFTKSEVTTIMLPDFDIVRFYSFNFGLFYYFLSKFLPYNVLVWTTISLENNASKLPKTWGSNWLICAKKLELS